MKNYFYYRNVFLLLLLVTIVACTKKDAELVPLQNWSERLIEIGELYQIDSVENKKELLAEFKLDYPWHSLAVLNKIKKHERWVASKDKIPQVDVVLKSLQSKGKTNTAFFLEKMNSIEDGDLKAKLLLVEEMILYQELCYLFDENDVVKIQRAVDDIESQYPDTYKKHKVEAQLEALAAERKDVERDLGDYSSELCEKMQIYNAHYEDVQRSILLANPLISEALIVFTAREQYAHDHHNSATLFHTNEINTEKYAPGGAMRVIDVKEGKITTLIETEEGVVRDPELSYDGGTIIFSMRNNIDEDYHIYTVSVDGEYMRQLTAAEGVSDIDPQFLPNGEIVFTSTREPKYCMCNRHIMGNIFKMESDGANITQLGKSSLFEGHSTVMPDGRILYDRWEYVDRNFGDAQGLWSMNPDGTNQTIYFGNNTASPGGFIDARPIPGTENVICVMGSCHDRPWGALGVLNRQKGVDGKASIETVWPASAASLIGKGNHDAFKIVRPYYEDPYPLNETYFLCARSINRYSEQMGIYLIDVFGNETLIHTEAPGCFNPIVVAPRMKEFSIKEKRNYKSESGKFYVQDVYKGTHMKGVERGAVKYLRVVESREKRSWTGPAWKGQGVHCPAMNWHSFECKRILGTVPVHADGSAYVEVPADKFVYFQVLDKDKKMIQSMRSGTMIHSGETQGCIGCHDDRRMSPPTANQQILEALKLAPEKLDGWFGKARNFGFMEEVQPVLDKHCVQCHDFGKKAGDALLLSGDRNPYFNAAYMDMHLTGVIKPIGGGPAEVQPAYGWGSNASLLVKKLEQGHAGVKLTEEEMQRITSWIDINAVYYSDFISAYPNNPVGRSPISDKDLNRLGKLTQVKFKALGDHRRKLGPQISFERPELSPCLQNIKDKQSAEYKEALAIIYKGKAELLLTPRLDMDKFIPSTADQKRLDKYQHRQDEEMKNRSAILEGQKHYDEGIKINQ